MLRKVLDAAGWMHPILRPGCGRVFRDTENISASAVAQLAAILVNRESGRISRLSRFHGAASSREWSKYPTSSFEEQTVARENKENENERPESDSRKITRQKQKNSVLLLISVMNVSNISIRVSTRKT